MDKIRYMGKEQIENFITILLDQKTQLEQKETETETNHDEYIDNLCCLGELYEYIFIYKKSIEYYEKCSKLCRLYKKEKIYGYCMHRVGLVYKNIGEMKKCIGSYLEALKVYKKMNDKESEGGIMNLIGIFYVDYGKEKKGLEYFLKGLEIEKEIGNKKGVVDSLSNIGSIYKNLKKPYESLKYQMKALEIQKQLGNKKEEATILSNIGLIYQDIGNQRKYLKYHMESLKIKKEFGDKEGESKILSRLGNYYRSFGKIKESLKYLKESLTLKKELGHKQGESFVLFCIGILYFEQKSYKKSFKYLNDSVELCLVVVLKFSSKDLNFCSFLEIIINRVSKLIDCCYKIRNFVEMLKNIEIMKSVSSVKDGDVTLLKERMMLSKVNKFKYPKNIYCLHYYYQKDFKELISIVSYNKDIKHHFVKENVEYEHIYKILSEFHLLRDFKVIKKNCIDLYKIIVADIESYLPKNEYFIIFPHSFVYLIPFNALLNEKNWQIFY